MRVLLTGWFSFPGMGATAGDLLARDVVARWLAESAFPFDVAHCAAFEGGVDIESADPSAYSHVIFVCGPIGNGPPIQEFLERYAHCRLVALDVSLLQSLDDWNPFDLLIERDSEHTQRPDFSLAADLESTPVAGIVLAHRQLEYGSRGRHPEADGAVWRLVERRGLAPVEIDTCLDPNTTRLRSRAMVTSLIARMDVVVTTRLHGLVLALKQGVPALAIDPIAGGAKVSAQARALAWPAVVDADELADDALDRVLDYCLSGEARARAIQSRDRGMAVLRQVEHQFKAYLSRQGRR